MSGIYNELYTSFVSLLEYMCILINKNKMTRTLTLDVEHNRGCHRSVVQVVVCEHVHRSDAHDGEVGNHPQARHDLKRNNNNILTLLKIAT